MILIKLNEANFEYDIYSLMRAFYPNEEVKVIGPDAVDHAGAEEKEEISFSVVIEYQGDKIILVIEDTDVKPIGADSSESVKIQTYSIDVHYEDRKDTKNKLKQLLYEVLNKRTGEELPWGTLTGIRPTKIPLSLLEEGKSADEIRAYMKQTYYANDEKIQLSLDITKRELAMLQQLDYEHGYSLYIGIPFCPSTCLYCSFTSYPVGIWKDRMDSYLDALDKEIDFIAKNLSHKTINSIYIGGGTPTSLSAMQLDRLLTKIETSLDLSNLLEFTVEAGRPDSITREKLEAIHRHAVDRISINPQTMKQETLDIIGRHHTVEDIVDSFRMAREIGFDNINMDLIMGLPGENIQDVEHTMQQVQKLAPDNLTVHSLAIKRAARLNIERSSYLQYPMETSQAHVDKAYEYATAMGMSPYYLYRQKNMAGNLENIGFAKEGKAGVYNILIMEEKQTIMALGAGAACKYVTEHGAIVDRSENVKDVQLYMDRIDEMIERKRKKLEEIQWL